MIVRCLSRSKAKPVSSPNVLLTRPRNLALCSRHFRTSNHWFPVACLSPHLHGRPLLIARPVDVRLLNRVPARVNLPVLLNDTAAWATHVDHEIPACAAIDALLFADLPALHACKTAQAPLLAFLFLVLLQTELVAENTYTPPPTPVHALSRPTKNVSANSSSFVVYRLQLRSIFAALRAHRFPRTSRKGGAAAQIVTYTNHSPCSRMHPPPYPCRSGQTVFRSSQ